MVSCPAIVATYNYVSRLCMACDICLSIWLVLLITISVSTSWMGGLSVGFIMNYETDIYLETFARDVLNSI